MLAGVVYIMKISGSYHKYLQLKSLHHFASGRLHKEICMLANQVPKDLKYMNN